MVLMVRRKLRAAYPLFYSFLALNTLTVAVGMLVYRYVATQYVYVYWTASTILMLLSFGVLYEVFVNLLKPYSALIDLGKMLFCWAAVFLLLAAFLTALVTSGPKVSRFMMAEELLDRCVHLMQCGLLLLLVLFEKRLNLSWRNSGMCVAIGVGLRAALDLGISYGTDRFPGHRDQMVTLYGVSFIAILAFWAFRLMGTDVAPATSASSPSRIILQRWNEALVGYRYGDLAFAPGNIDSFLPGVEQTVDRVLARKMVQ
ncbi:MAG TPA: hypothetical protein VE133_06090 [Candidatus Sulfotelmatobacter sp.]|nr:hypothetical protein [Candidatus Sulfotelmatobacter sp.]